MVTGASAFPTSASRQSEEPGVEFPAADVAAEEAGLCGVFISAAGDGRGVFAAGGAPVCQARSGVNPPGTARQTTALNKIARAVAQNTEEAGPEPGVLRMLEIISFRHAPREHGLRRHECGRARSRGPQSDSGSENRAPEAPHPGRLCVRSISPLHA